MAKEKLFARSGVFKVRKVTNRLVIAGLVALKDEQTPFCAFDYTYLLLYSGRQRQNLNLSEGELIVGFINDVSEEEKTAYLEVRDEEPTHGIYLAYCKLCRCVLEKDKKYQEAICPRCDSTDVRKYSVLYNTDIF